MSDIEQARDRARLHWLILGAFSPRPQGRVFVATREGFADCLQQCELQMQLPVADALGDGATRSYRVDFQRLRSFTLQGIVEGDEQLSQLCELASDLARPAARPSPEAVIQRVEQLVGPGALYRRLQKLQAAARPPASEAGDPAGGDSPAADPVQGIFERAEVGKPRTAAGAIDAFVKATRSESAASGASAAVARDASRLIEDAVYVTAAEITRATTVAELESCWRGLKLLVDQLPAAGEVLLEVVDTEPGEVCEVLRARGSEEPFDLPDAIFVVSPLQTLEALSEIAELGEQLYIPCVLAIEPDLIGVSDPFSAEDGQQQPAAERWAALRQNDAARWLCVTANPIAVFGEGAGEAKRTVFASPVWSLGAAMTASFRQVGTFSRILGAEGRLRAPATWIIPREPGKGLAAPTRDFLSIRAQTRLAALGVTGIGSARNSDALMLSAVPTAYQGEGPGALPLPAQILTGRVVRFSSWVASQLSARSSDEEIAQVYADASRAFLFPGMDRSARLAARAVRREGSSAVAIEAKASAAYAGAPFEIEIEVPLSD